MNSLQFSTDQFSDLFPYHMCFDEHGKITSHGRYLKNLAGITAGSDFFELFLCKTDYSEEPVTSAASLPINESVSLRLNSSPAIVLKGKFAPLQNAAPCFVFIGSPTYNFEGERAAELVGNNYEENAIYKTLQEFDLGVSGIESTVKELKDYENVLNFPDGSSRIRDFAITVSDDSGRVVWCNKNFERMSGRSYAEIIGRRPREAIYGKRSVFIDKNYVDDKVRSGESFYFENIGYSAQGREFWFGVVVKAVFNAKQDVVGRIHFLRDISNRKDKELAIEENQKLMSLALDAAKVGVWSYDTISREFVTAGNFRPIIGFKDTGDLQLTTFLRMMHPEDLKELYCNVLPKVTKEKPSFDIVHRIMVTGEYHYFNVRGLCVQWTGSGRPVKIVGTLRDRTGDIKHLFEISEQKRFYNNILDKIPVDIALYDLECRYSYVNRNAVKSDEIRDWMIGKDDSDYARLKGLDISFGLNRTQVIRDVIETGVSNRIVETKVVDGVRKHYMRVISPVLKENELEMVIAYGLDISEQAENENKIKVEEERARNFLRIVKDGVFLSDFSGRIINCSPSFWEIVGLKNMTSDLSLFSLLTTSHAQMLSQKVATLFATGAPQSGVFKLGRKFVDFTFALRPGDEQDRFVGRISDITIEVNKEKHLIKLLKIESELNKRKTQFIHITSHELRTPLTVISTNSELLELIEANPALAARTSLSNITRRIIKEVRVMTDILNQLMMVSKIERGGLELVPLNVDVQSYIKNEIAPLFSPFSDGRELVTEIDDNATLGEFDPKIFKHVLVNIIGNAFKYSPGKAAPQLHISATQHSLEFIVRDFGIGIPPKEISSIFSNFYRASNIGVISGTGIGLMVAEYGIKKHGGEISIKSELNEGSVFTITLPQNR